jgi:hypothetical protein
MDLTEIKLTVVKVQQNLFSQGDWDQLKAGVSCEEYVSCHNGIVAWDVNRRTNDG